MRYRLRTLLLLFLIAALFLSATVQFVRWTHSRPGRLVTGTGQSGRPYELDYVLWQLGHTSLQELQIWRLHRSWLGNDFVWQANASPDVVAKLQQYIGLKQILVSQVPKEFWNMPTEWSDMPTWWKPHQIAGALYYKSPTFVPQHLFGNDRLTGVVMYDPEQQRVYVWSESDYY